MTRCECARDGGWEREDAAAAAAEAAAAMAAAAAEAKAIAAFSLWSDAVFALSCAQVEYVRLMEAMSNIGVNKDDQEAVSRLLAGLLHIGNTCFTGEDEAAIDGATTAALTKGMGLMQVAGLEKSLVSSTLSTRGEVTVINLTKEKAALARDALCKAVYARLFEWVVGRVNEKNGAEALKANEDGESLKFIGLLDIFGFESFAINTFEQLCINFANEKLQQFFLKFVFKAEEDLYSTECVAWTRIEYQDNQGCIDLVEKSPTGIMRVLDEQCKKPGSDAEKKDKAFCTEVAEKHRRNDFFMDARGAGQKNYRVEEAFAVRHFAGDVCYVGAGFCDKNNDTLHSDFVQLCLASAHGILPKLFESEAGARKANTFNSVSRRFINDLNQLMVDLNSTRAHFIRCIKPNVTLAAFKFTPSLVLTQLRCSGTIDAVQLMAGAYPTRIPYESIYGRYASQMPDFVQKLEPPLFCEALALALEIDTKVRATPRQSMHCYMLPRQRASSNLARTAAHPCSLPRAQDFALGRSKIFFKAGKGQVLEELAERDLSEVIPMLIEKIKMWEKRKAMQIKLQAYSRMFLSARYFRRARAAAKKIQHRRMSQKLWVEYRKRHLAWVAKREREEAERRRKEAEERKRKEEEAAAKAKAEAEAAAAAIANAKDAEARKKAEAEAAAAAKAQQEAASHRWVAPAARARVQRPARRRG